MVAKTAVATTGAGQSAPDTPAADSATVTNIADARKVRQLEKVRFKSAEFTRTVYSVFPFENTTPDDLLSPDYWAHVASEFKQYDRVEVLANDGTWWAEYIVVSCGRAYAQLRLLRAVDLDPVAQDMALSKVLREYEVRHRGPHSQWSVIRRSDKEVVHEFSQTETDANTWLTNHLKALGR